VSRVTRWPDGSRLTDALLHRNEQSGYRSNSRDARPAPAAVSSNSRGQMQPSSGRWNVHIAIAGTGQLSTQCRRTSRNAYVRTARLGSTDSSMKDCVSTASQMACSYPDRHGCGYGRRNVVNEKQEPSVNVPVVLVPDPRGGIDRISIETCQPTRPAVSISDVPPEITSFSPGRCRECAWQDPDFIRQYRGSWKGGSHKSIRHGNYGVDDHPAQM